MSSRLISYISHNNQYGALLKSYKFTTVTANSNMSSSSHNYGLSKPLQNGGEFPITNQTQSRVIHGVNEPQLFQIRMEPGVSVTGQIDIFC